MKFHIDGTTPAALPGRDTVFVFGSNLAGRHGLGAALAAAKHFGAELGIGRGRTGRAYAIATKGAKLEVLPLDQIQPQIEEFLAYARERPSTHFFVTRVGCALAGYKDAQIAPLFRGAPENCSFAHEWKSFLQGEADLEAAPAERPRA